MPGTPTGPNLNMEFETGTPDRPAVATYFPNTTTITEGERTALSSNLKGELRTEIPRVVLSANAMIPVLDEIKVILQSINYTLMLIVGGETRQ